MPLHTLIRPSTPPLKIPKQKKSGTGDGFFTGTIPISILKFQNHLQMEQNSVFEVHLPQKKITNTNWTLCTACSKDHRFELVRNAAVHDGAIP